MLCPFAKYPISLGAIILSAPLCWADELSVEQVRAATTELEKLTEIDGKWVQKYQRDPDTESPAGGVSSSVNDVAKWMRLQLAGGKFDGKEIVNQDAFSETHQPHMLTGFSALNGLPGFYGLGWNVSYAAGRGFASRQLLRAGRVARAG